MKKIIFVFMFVMLIGLVSAVEIDQFEDDVINTSIWNEEESGPDTIAEEGGYLGVFADGDGVGGLKWSNITTLSSFDIFERYTTNITYEYIYSAIPAGSNKVVVYLTDGDNEVTIDNHTDEGSGSGIGNFYRSGSYIFSGTSNWSLSNWSNVQFGFRTEVNPNTADFYINMSYINGTLAEAITGVALTAPSNGSVTSSNPLGFNATIFPITDGRVDNATLYIWNSTNDLVNTSYTEFDSIINERNTSSFSVPNLTLGIYTWNVLGCANASTAGNCDFAPQNLTFDYGYQFNSITLNSSTYETASETISANVTHLSSSTLNNANLIHNSTIYSGTITTVGPDKILTVTIDVPLASASFDTTALWELVFSSGARVNSTAQTQTIIPTNFSICGDGTQNTNYLNISYRNESTSQEWLNATVPSSTLEYYLGGGDVTRTYTYSTSSLNYNNTFCYTPANRTVWLDIDYDYTNGDSEQRTYNPAPFTLTNVTTNIVLWLLPTADTSYITFNVISVAGQTIENALLQLTRSSYGVVYSAYTGASGSLTVALDPDVTYTLSVNASGYPAFEETDTFPSSPVTVTLGSTNVSSNITDTSRGVNITIQPSASTLSNDTTYNFNLTIGSSYSAITDFGFYIKNSSGDTLGSATATTNGGIVNDNVATGSNSVIIMEYYWVIDSIYNNYTRQWVVENDEKTGWSLKRFGTSLSTFLSQGRFGLTPLGLNILVFFVIFSVTGFVSYRFGFNSPMPVLITLAVLTLIFDVLGLIYYPDSLENLQFIGGYVATFVTMLAALVSSIVTFRR